MCPPGHAHRLILITAIFLITVAWCILMIPVWDFAIPCLLPLLPPSQARIKSYWLVESWGVSTAIISTIVEWVDFWRYTVWRDPIGELSWVPLPTLCSMFIFRSYFVSQSEALSTSRVIKATGVATWAWLQDFPHHFCLPHPLTSFPSFPWPS